MPKPDANHDEERVESPGSRGASRIGLVSLAVSVLLMIGGIAFGVLAGGSPTLATGGAAGTSGTPSVTEFAPTGEPGDAAPDDSGGGNTWSPIMFRLGFSFFIGYVIAFAMRAFLRFTVLAIGLAALLLMGLEYGGFVEVHWTLLGDRFDGFGAWLQAQSTSFTQFMRGALPSAASAGCGFVLGLRRR